MLVRRSVSGKHLLIWLGVLLVIGLLLVAVAFLLKAVVHRPTLLASDVQRVQTASTRSMCV